MVGPALSSTGVGRTTYALDFSTLNTIKLNVSGGLANFDVRAAVGDADDGIGDVPAKGGASTACKGKSGASRSSSPAMPTSVNSA